MTTPPTVTARYDEPRIEDSQLCGPRRATPGVTVELSFDLHDHAAALAALDRAAANVRAQIEETR
ncbi:hypothetical protein [Segeticoccus rhizosphaerae]|uniref:hypothetical protein n=1 Tax=Segeticoccus rhizosphaerae TaxID=1104777 RepID=UPI001264DDCA|nr:hypothetical protein [Segeticoccus rhizosphaerae]